MDKTVFSGAVLAGGRSLRMGRDKAGLEINGKTFLQIQAEKLADAGISDIMICGGSRLYEDEEPGPVMPDQFSGAMLRTVADKTPGLGPLEGIRSALEASENPFCVILSVDAVLVKPETLRSLMDLARKNRSAITLLASERGPEPLIGVYSKEILPEASKCLAEGRRAVRAVFEAFPPALLALPANDPQLSNCNTPEEYQRLLQRSMDEEAQP